MSHVTSCMRVVVVGFVLAGLAGVTAAQDAPRADDSRIQKLVADLGDKDFKVREAATKELTAVGPDARSALKKAQTSSDPEVAQRAKTILSEITKACFDAANARIQKNLLWNYSMKDGVAGRISIKDGVAYVAGADQALHAVDIKTGKEKWSQGQLSEDAAAVLSGALLADKMALALLDNGDAAGLDIADGKVSWKYKREQVATEPAANPALMPGAGGGAAGGIVMIVRGVVTFGQPRWAKPAAAGSTLFLPQEDRVVLLDTQTGKKLKEIKLCNPALGSPTVDGDRMIVHLTDGTIRGYSICDGGETWKRTGGKRPVSIACSAGKAYFIDDSTTMYALDCATGKELWKCSVVPEETGGAGGGGMGGQVGGGMRANIQMPVMTTPQNPPAIKDGTLYTIQGSALIAVDANSGKKKFQCQIDAWRDETPDATGRPRNQLMRAKLRMAPGLAQTVPSFAIDGNIAYVNAGQLGIYAVRLDDGLAQWALGTSNMPVGDMVLLDGVLYFGTSEDQTGNVMMPGVGLLRPAQPPAAVGAAPAKPADEGKDVMPAGLHALKVK